MTYGDPNWQPWIMDEEAALPILKHAYDRGINTWDVADSYSNGKSEEIIGKALKKYNIPRSRVVIMTKCFFHVDEERCPFNAGELSFNDGDRVNCAGLSRKHIFDAMRGVCRDWARISTCCRFVEWIAIRLWRRL